MTARYRAVYTVACLIILLLGFALRMTRLDRSLNYDELVTAKSILVDRLNPTKVEARMFVYLMLNAPIGWLSANEWGLRWTSVMAGVLSIALAYRIASRVGDRWAGLISGVIMTVAPFYIHYSQIARYYSLVACFSLLTLLFLIERSNSRRWSYPLSIALLSGLHMLTVPWAVTQIAVESVLKAITGRGLRWSVLIGSLLGIAAILGLIQLIGLFGRFNFAQGLDWIQVRSPLVDSIYFMGSALGLMLDFGQTELPFRVVNCIIAGVCLISGVGLWRRWKARTDHTDWAIPLLIALAGVPLLMIMAVSYTFFPLFIVRYLMPSAVTIVLLVGIGMSAVRPQWIGNSALVVLTLVSLTSYSAFITNPKYYREDWRGAVGAIEDKWAAADQVIVCANSGARAVDYYAPEIPYQRLEQAGTPSARRIWLIGVLAECDSLQDRAAWLEDYQLEAQHDFRPGVVYVFERAANGD